MTELFASEDNNALLLVDADNAFNRLNRSTALWNIRYICPPLKIFAENCYTTSSRLFVTGGMELTSQEGTTQGDPLSMPFYALSLMPLIRELHGLVKQIWYADDAQATGKLSALRKWWDMLVERGPGYGYHVNAMKTILVVKHSFKEDADLIFSGTGIKLSEGARDLGGVIGSEDFSTHFVSKKVSSFCEEMELLSHFAVSSPHAAHAAFVHGLRHRWLFLQRTIPNISYLFQPLEDIIREKFIPALLGGQLVSEAERLMLSLPGRYGGLALDNPTNTCANNHSFSCKLSKQLTEQLTTQKQHLRLDPLIQDAVRQAIHAEREQKFKEDVQALKNCLPPDRFRALLCAQEKGSSVVVTTLPLKRFNFALSKHEFRDQILMRYRWPVPDLPMTCACGSPFTVDHSQICHVGGFINMRHDEVRNLLATEIKEVLKDVEMEPVLTPLTGETLQPQSANSQDDARADIRARGFWNRMQDAFFDVRVFYPHASSYVTRTLPSLYATFEKSKKREYLDRIVHIEQGSFTPLVFSSMGGMGKETAIAIKHLAQSLSESRNEPYSRTIGVLRCRLAFALMRASSVCLRGSRSRRTRHIDFSSPADLVMSEARLEHL
jgi:hypothetical protein